MGPGHQGFGVGCCLTRVVPHLWAGRCGDRSSQPIDPQGTPAGTASCPPAPRVSHHPLSSVQVDRLSRVGRWLLRSEPAHTGPRGLGCNSPTAFN